MEKNLLQESTYSGADFDKAFMDPVKKAMGHFGKTVSASAKLIGNDVATIIKLNVHWKLRGLGAQKEIMDNWKQNRGKHLKTIYENQNAALESLGVDKFTVMAMCPATFWGTAAYRGTGTLLSKGTREAIGEYGAGNLPLIGTLFGGPKARGGDPSFWDRLMRGSNEDPGSPEAKASLERELTAWLRDKGVDVSGTREAPSSGIKNILYKINDIFLLSASHAPKGTVIFEGEEDKEKSWMEDAEEVVTDLIEENLTNAFQEERTAYLEEHKEVFDGVVNSVEQVLELNISLATVQDADEFIKIFETTVKKNKEFQGMDVEKIKSEFQGMIKTLSEDEKVIATLREELEKSGELSDLQEGEDSPVGGISEKEKPIFEKHIKKIALDNCKGGFLQTLKEGTIDLYEQVRFEVTDGLQEETMDTIEKTATKDKIALEYIDQIRGFQKRLDEVMSKLK